MSLCVKPCACNMNGTAPSIDDAAKSLEDSRIGRSGVPDSREGNSGRSAAMNKVFLVIESTVRTKQKRIPLSQWPTTSTFCCFSCTCDMQEIKTVPVPLVHINANVEKSTIHVLVDQFETGRPFPIFCSVNCMMNNIKTSDLPNKQRLLINAFLLQQLWRRHFSFEQVDCYLHTLPPYRLEKFGGTMTFHEYRRGFCAFVPTPSSGTMSCQFKESEQDSIYWPNRFPHTLSSSIATDPRIIQIPPSLTSMDDPTDVLMPGDLTTPARDTNPNNNVTIQLVSDVLKSTIHHQSIQDVSNQLRQMELCTTTSNESSSMDSKETKQRPIKRQKKCATSPPRPTTLSQSTSVRNTTTPTSNPNTSQQAPSSKFTQMQHAMFRTRTKG